MSKPTKGNGIRAKFRNFIRKAIWPVTPLTIVTTASIVVTIWAWTLYFITRPSEALVVAVTTAISFLLVTLYVADRLLTNVLSYKSLVLGKSYR